MIKKYTNKNGRDNVDKLHPYTIFKQQGFYEKLCRNASCLYYPYTSVLFDPTIPT